MATMKRGSNVALTREIPSLTGLVLGVRWDAGAETALTDNLVNGKVTVKLPKLKRGVHRVQVNYLGSSTTKPSTSTSVRLKVIKNH